MSSRKLSTVCIAIALLVAACGGSHGNAVTAPSGPTTTAPPPVVKFGTLDSPCGPGKATGAVLVCKTAGDAEAIHEGDILVCGMTSPDYVPAMKRAGAIVTDEGGLLCHAAIISRELGKPCVIATKNATLILMTGDQVEVDADKGIVKILKNQ